MQHALTKSRKLVCNQYFNKITKERTKKFRDRTGGKCDRTEWVSNRKEDKSEANRAEVITIKHI